MKTQSSQLAEARVAGLQLKALHDAEILELGEGRTQPRSRGQVYDIPPLDGTYCPDRVDQTGQDAVDINALMRRYEKTGKLEELIAAGMGDASGMLYGDFTDAPTFQEAMNVTVHATRQFGLLDAKLRNRFQGDPAKFLAFMSDEANLAEQYALGLRVKPAVAPVAPSPAAAPEVPAAPVK